MFFPDIYFCDVFNLPIIKDTLAERVPGIDWKLRKVNVSTSFMRIGIRNNKTNETVYKEDEFIVAFEASFILLIEGGHIKNRV